MPALPNLQHEKFVQELVKGKSQGDAYLAAGYKAKSVAVASAAATRLLKIVSIQARIAELQAKIEDETLLTLNEHMRELRKLRDMAKAEGDLKAAITAEVKRGELRRFYVKQIEAGPAGAFDHLDDDELSRTIEALAEEVQEIEQALLPPPKPKERNRAGKH